MAGHRGPRPEAGRPRAARVSPAAPGETGEPAGLEAERYLLRERRRAARGRCCAAGVRLAAHAHRGPHPHRLRARRLPAVALDVDRPYWAVVTAPSVFPVSVTLSWNRSLQRIIGAVVGLLAAIAVTNRRAAGRVERALAATERLRADAERTLADPAAAPAAPHDAGRRLAAAFVEPREAHDAAVGEWWQRDLAEQQVLAAEQAAHRTLAATAERRGRPGQGLAPVPSIGAV
ncbi:FUSC family protein [Streptomyces xantholiticus]|uniref:FUSC family protein n=1 Tax=Streptomyces xantholiticus TaxID=68285 RepID=UPI0019BAB526|nr:hypothetical protein GCM10010381_05730 [Streptomyces xantholiticus]